MIEPAPKKTFAEMIARWTTNNDGTTLDIVELGVAGSTTVCGAVVAMILESW